MTREAEPRPGWLQRALHTDLSPLRPWEWDVAPADSWTEALEIQNAYAAGERDARDEAAMERRLSEMETVA